MQKIKFYWSKSWVKCLTIFCLVFLILFLLRAPILRGVGNYLYSHDPLEQSDAIFVLGGNSFERGLEAAAVYKQFPKTPVYSTGANIPMQLLAFDTTLTEAQLTTMWLVKNGVPDSYAIPLNTGTSTREEADSIYNFCQQNQLKKITVISSSFHLRRVRQVFESKFEGSATDVNFHGSASKDFDPNEWWKHEEGLITVNNELMKMVYYMLH